MPSPQEMSSIALKTGVSYLAGMAIYGEQFSAKNAAEDAAVFAVSKYFLEGKIEDMLAGVGAFEGLSPQNAMLLSDLAASLGTAALADLVRGKSPMLMRKLVKYGAAEVAASVAAKNMPETFK